MGDTEGKTDPVKILLVGNGGVGKTSILNLLLGDRLAEPNDDTWDLKNMTVPYRGGSRQVILTDTAGQERFRELTSISYKCVDVVYLVYSIDDRDSFKDINHWIEQVNIYLPGNTVPRILVASKIDLENRVISTQEGEDFAKSHGMTYLETSAKENKGIQEVLKLALDPPVAKGGDKEKGGCCNVQ